jgi:hypothetical protein
MKWKFGPDPLRLLFVPISFAHRHLRELLSSRRHGWPIYVPSAGVHLIGERFPPGHNFLICGGIRH